jgi:uncharacterized damage-inducible protein DinB
MAGTEIDDLLDDLRRSLDGDPWHGPPLRALLDGLTDEVADARPVAGWHSIREVVVHVAAWDEVVASRIEGLALDEPEGGPFPPASAAGWRADLDRLDAAQRRLLAVVAGLDPSRLADPVAGKEYAIGHMIRGVAQHRAYHGGQIALLRRLAGVPPA